ncbi:MAG TPA: YebC/PmpR family DNA-binding transcriptional regulator [Chloroflexia bacterium]|nr:YebC/PmpR family DNA-binding transcriptional regulator [Chloroflexia bacterium]
MSGHSKWATIKHKKEMTDNKRGQLFTKLTREITVAAREGGADMDSNFRLRLAVQRAKAESMPADNIKRAIERGAGGGAGGANYEEVTYEGKGPGGTALIVSALTDNRNRTVAEVRAAFTRGGGSLGESGSAAWIFDTMGVIEVQVDPKQDMDEAELAAIDAGAQDVKRDDDERVLEVYSAFTDLKAVTDALAGAGMNVTSSAKALVPKTTAQLDEEKAQQVLKLIDRLEELDDVQQVYSNLELSDAQMAALG